MALKCKHCNKRLTLKARRMGFCDEQCQHRYNQAHGIGEALPRLFDTPEPPRPTRLISPAQLHINRQHGKDNRGQS